MDSNEFRLRATYHDPCNLGRLNGIYDAPRRIFSSIPGLEIVEMERNKESAWCCGGGGMVSVSYPKLGSWTASERLKEATKSFSEMPRILDMIDLFKTKKAR